MKGISISFIFHAIISSGYFASGYDVRSAPGCTDASLENPGYSSVYREGLDFWSHCAFPNPKQAASRCGRTYNASVTYDLCDPDGVLDAITQDELDTSLWSVERSTQYQCTPWHGTVLNYTVLVVAVQHTRVPDLSGNDTCKNTCEELMPELDVFARAPTLEEKHAALDSFAQGLVSNFDAYFCDNYAVIAYWANESMVSTALSAGASALISDAAVAEVELAAQLTIDSGEVGAGLRLMVDRYKVLLVGWTPAWILCIMSVCAVVLVALVVALCLNFGSKSDYFDEEAWKLALRAAVRVVVGVWFIEMLLLLLVKFQDLMRPGFVVLPLVGCLVATGVAVWLFLVDSRGDTGIAAL